MVLPTPRQSEILDLAQYMIQTRGYNGFSFGDLAKKIGVKPAAIHYHFPTKGDLGLKLMARYRQRLHASLARIDEQVQSPRRKLERYVLLFHATLKPDNRMCLCGMLATEMAILPEPLAEEVKKFFEDNESWLARVLGEGRRARSIDFEGSPTAASRFMYASLQGAMISSRVFGDAGRLSLSGRWLLDALITPMMDALLMPPQ